MMCSSRKVRFGTREQAEAGAQKIANRDRVKLRVYQCQRCHGWHRTSKYGGGAKQWFRPATGDSNADRS